ncbi:MAG: DUF4412 domain-containing protein [Gemmatimonas sp.]
MRIARPLALSLAIGVLTAASSSVASAQILKKIGQRASDAVERKTESKVNEKIDKAADRLVNKSFDSVFGSDDASNKSSGNRGGSSMFKMLPNAPTEDHYDFNVVLTYEIENSPKGKPSGDKAEMLMNFSTKNPYAGVKIKSAEPKKGDGDLFAIFDVKNEAMVMLFNSDDGKFSIAYGWHDAVKYADTVTAPKTTGGAGGTTTTTANGSTMTWTKIGSRKIAGYSADGYRAEDDKSIVEVWVSTDASLDFGRMMGATSSMKQLRTTVPPNHPVGLLMETNSTDKKTGDKGRMTVTSVDKNASVRVNMSDYPRPGNSK